MTFPSLTINYVVTKLREVNMGGGFHKQTGVVALHVGRMVQRSGVPFCQQKQSFKRTEGLQVALLVFILAQNEPQDQALTMMPEPVVDCETSSQGAWTWKDMVPS